MCLGSGLAEVEGGYDGAKWILASCEQWSTLANAVVIVRIPSAEVSSMRHQAAEPASRPTVALYRHPGGKDTLEYSGAFLPFFR